MPSRPPSPCRPRPVPLDGRAEAPRVGRASGNAWALAFAIRIVAHVDKRTGAYAAAYAGYVEAAAMNQQMRDRHFYNASRSEMAHVRRLQGRHAEAAALYAETIRVWQELGQRPAVARELECLAYLAAADGPAERPATLLGAAEALREQLGAPMPLVERAEYDQAVAGPRAPRRPRWRRPGRAGGG